MVKKIGEPRFPSTSGRTFLIMMLIVQRSPIDQSGALEEASSGAVAALCHHP